MEFLAIIAIVGIGGWLLNRWCKAQDTPKAQIGVGRGEEEIPTPPGYVKIAYSKDWMCQWEYVNPIVKHQPETGASSTLRIPRPNEILVQYWFSDMNGQPRLGKRGGRRYGYHKSDFEELAEWVVWVHLRDRGIENPPWSKADELDIFPPPDGFVVLYMR